MDYTLIILAGIGGGIGGAIGALLRKRFSGKNAQTLAMILPIVVFSQLASSLAKNQSIRDKISPPSRFELMVRETTDQLRENKKFLEATQGMSLAQIKGFTQSQTQKGLRRLPAKELLKWNQLRIRMATINKRVCAGLWTGIIAPHSIHDVMNKFNDEELRSWLTLSTKAALLEIEQAEFTPVEDATLASGIRLIALTMSEEDALRLNNSLQAGVSADEDEACWTMLTLLEGSKKFEEKQRIDFIRALASI